MWIIGSEDRCKLVMIKAVIFDMDGVLVDACDWHRISLNQALMDVCGFEISLEEHYKTFNGIPTKKKLELLLEDGKINKNLIPKIEKQKQENTILCIEKYAKIRQEKIDLINYLKSQGISVVCYTNSIRKTAQMMLEKTGVLSLLEFLITNQDVKNPKPHPEGYLLCLEKLNLKKEECIIIEDSPKGVEAAKKSGIPYKVVKNPDEGGL